MTLREGIKKLKDSDTESPSEHVKEGTVHSLSAGYDDDGMCDISIETPAPKAGKGDGEKDSPPAMAPHVSAKIPAKHAGRFAVGDKVRLTTRVEKVTKGAD
jgi:hypothetical protein